MNLQFSNKLDEGVYEVAIRGIIGKDIDGIKLAEEIELLNTLGATKIIERINSAGGDVFNGFPIVSANMNSDATIETINEGIAASMAAVILATGDIRKTLDYGTGLIHDPQLNGVSLENIEDEKTRTDMQKIKDSLITILQNACHKPRNTISKFMTVSTVMSAAEMLDFGLVDTVVKSKTLRPNLKNLSALEIMNVYNELKTNTLKVNTMDKLTAFFKLQKGADEETILDAATNLQTKNQSLSDEVDNLKNQLKSKDDELTAANAELESSRAATVTNLIDTAIKDGKFDESKRQELENHAKKDFDGFKFLVDSIKAQPRQTVTDVIKQNGGVADDKKPKDWEYYQKHDPDHLKQLEATNKPEFERLLNEYETKLNG